MDFNDTPEEAAFRAEARAFLAANARTASAGARPVLRLGGIDAEAVKRCKAWQAKKADAGFAGHHLAEALRRPRGLADPAGDLPAGGRGFRRCRAACSRSVSACASRP